MIATTFSRNLSLFFILAGFSILLMIADYFSLLKELRATTEKLINPLRWEIGKPFKAFYSQRDSSQNSAILQSKIDFLEGEKAVLEAKTASLEEENKALRESLAVKTNGKESLLLAKNLAVIDGLMRIDKGEKDGLYKGAVVLSSKILVGRIIETTPHSAQVLLPVSEESRIKVKILPTGEKGILGGLSSSGLVLEEILQEVKLENGQLIVTSGEEAIYPPDLPIGKIEEIFKDDVKLYKKAEVKSLLDYQALKVVMVRI